MAKPLKQTQQQSWPVKPSSRIAVKRHEWMRACTEGLSEAESARRCEFAAECAHKFGLDLAGWLEYTGQL